jgi:hypothetical protein
MKAIRPQPPEREERPVDDEEREERATSSVGRRRGGPGASEAGHAGGPADAHFSKLMARETNGGRTAGRPLPAELEHPEPNLPLERSRADALGDAPPAVQAALANDLDRDPTLNARLSGSSAHLSLETGVGTLTVHLRVRGQAAEVHLVGPPAAALAERELDLGASLTAQGLTLAAVRVGEPPPAAPLPTSETSETFETSETSETSEPLPTKPAARLRGRVRVKA